MSRNYLSQRVILFVFVVLLHSHMIRSQGCECPSCNQMDSKARCQCCVYRHFGKRSEYSPDNIQSPHTVSGGPSSFSDASIFRHLSVKTNSAPSANYGSNQAGFDKSLDEKLWYLLTTFDLTPDVETILSPYFRDQKLRHYLEGVASRTADGNPNFRRFKELRDVDVEPSMFKSELDKDFDPSSDGVPRASRFRRSVRQNAVQP